MSQKNPYEDMLCLPYQKSRVHKHMSNYDRAAQFAPFAALKGYEEAIEETARLTDTIIDLSESVLEELDEKYAILEDHVHEHPSLRITRFVQDVLKEGGRYETVQVSIRSIDRVNRMMVTMDREKIYFAEITAMEGELFQLTEHE